MKKVIILGIAVAFLCAAGFASNTLAEDPGPAEITLEVKDSAKPKPAVFPHKAHQERGVACDDCHKSESYTPGAWTKDSGHKLCKDCHKASGNKAINKCGVCHPKKQ